MSKAVLNSSVVIALSTLGYLDKVKNVFNDVLIPKAVYEEVCAKGHGLTGGQELLKAVDAGLIRVRDVENRMLVNALLDPLALGEAETIALTIEEHADCVVLDDKLARRRAKSMGLNVIGTLRILRLLYDAKLIDKEALTKDLRKLREAGFRISDGVINRILQQL